MRRNSTKECLFNRRNHALIPLLLSILAIVVIVPAHCADKNLSAQPADRISVSLKQLEKYKSISVSAEENGKTVKFDGIPLRTLLKELLPQYNLDEMKDWKEIARNRYVMEASGSDGYPGLVTALEVAMNKTGDRYILATHRDSKLIESGPQLVCKSDQAKARWVREVVLLRITKVPAATEKL